MDQLFDGISSLTFWDITADIHGLLAMLLLILLGGAIMLVLLPASTRTLTLWIRRITYVLFINIAILDLLGLFVYGAYRKSGGPRSALLSSPDTSWLHSIIFEHKEMLAFAPLILLFVACKLADVIHRSTDNALVGRARKTLIFTLVSTLIITLAVAGEAVLVTKVAPLR